MYQGQIRNHSPLPAGTSLDPAGRCQNYFGLGRLDSFRALVRRETTEYDAVDGAEVGRCEHC